MKLIYSSLFLFAMVSAVMMAEWERESHEFEDKTEFCSAEKKPSDTLQSIFVIQRYSSAGPHYLLPKVPLDSNCNILPYQVTSAGVKQTYDIVQFFKDRYGSFLPTDPNESFFRSTNTDRTLYSASLKQRGFFPYKKDPAFVPSSPFFNPQRNLDYLYYGVHCPAADQEINYNNLLTIDAATFNQTNAKLFDYLSRKTGLPADINILKAVYDYISALKYNGCKLPEFYSNKLFAEVERQFAALSNLWCSSDLAKTLRGGPFAQELLKRIDFFIRASLQGPCDQPIPKRKLHIYETHSYSISAFLNVLGLPITTPIRTGATLICELHNINGHEYLQFYILDETESTPFGPLKSLTLVGSRKTYGISLQNFKSLVAPYIPTNFNKQCQIPCTFDYRQGFEDFVSETDDTNGPEALVYE